MIDPNGLAYHMFTAIMGLEAPGLTSEQMESLERIGRLSFLKFEDHESYGLLQSLGKASGGDGDTQLGYSSESQHAAVGGSVMLSFSYGLLVPTGTSAVMRSDVGVEGEAIRTGYVNVEENEISNYRPLSISGLTQSEDNHCVFKNYEEVAMKYGLEKYNKSVIIFKARLLGLGTSSEGVTIYDMGKLANTIGLNLEIVWQPNNSSIPHPTRSGDFYNSINISIKNNSVPLLVIWKNGGFHSLIIVKCSVYENVNTNEKRYQLYHYDPIDGKIHNTFNLFDVSYLNQVQMFWYLYFINKNN